jgi:GntP family gluconate:H+ symporter
MLLAAAPDPTSLLVCAAIGVLGLIILVARFKLNSVLALIVASLFVGVASGMNLPEIGKAFQEGVGKVLADIAMVVGLGTVLGKLLAESGGAQVVADTLIRSLGQQRLPWAMMLVAFIVGLPVFFAVGLVLLAPILFTVARQSGTPLLQLGLPLVAGLSVAHGLVPPHPGPMAAVASLHGPEGQPADLGKVILYSILIGLPVAVVSGPLLRKWIVGRETVPLAGGIGDAMSAPAAPPRKPGFVLTIFSILLPVLLMLLKTAADVTRQEGDTLRRWADFLGSPLVAMTLATLFALWSFGTARGFSRDQVSKFTSDCLGPAAIVLLVVGAGGGFNGVLIASGAGKAIGEMTKQLPLSPLVVGWIVAALIRVATGSATVAIMTASGLLAERVSSTPGLNLELMVLAMGAGSVVLSHVNDGGFWLVKEYLNMTVEQTLRTWTMLETLISFLTLGLVLLIDLVI